MQNANENKAISSVKNALLKRIHIFQWITKYTKIDFISDVIAGITVGLTMIPQSIAYAGIANLPAQYGLYTAFIGSFTYIIFGTIKQVSIGPTSLMSMITITYLDGYPVEYVILLTFIAGSVELLMGILNLGFIVDFISPSVQSGFTSATSVLIIGTQLKSFFGLRRGNSHNFVDAVYMVFEQRNEIKFEDMTLGICCIVFLTLLKQITNIKTKNDKIKKSLWLLSISRNAITVVITASIGFYYMSTKGYSPFILSGPVPSGLPKFALPSFSYNDGNSTHSFYEMVGTIGAGVFIIPICAVLTNIAIASSFASGAIIDASQEMMTLGLCNIFGSCVQALPSSGAFSRSAVANSSGVRTPLQGLYSGTIIILALSFLTPYFYYIPKATLAAVLITAVLSLIDVAIIPVLWKINKIDFLLNILTFAVGVIYGADIGIIMGAILNLTVLLKEWSRPAIEVSVETWEKGKEYILIKPLFGLLYPGRDHLTKTVIKAHNSDNLPMVLDCGRITVIDYAAVEALSNLIEMYNENNNKLAVINLKSEIILTMRNMVQENRMKFCQSTSDLNEDFFVNESDTLIPLLFDEGSKKLVQANMRKKSIYEEEI